MGYRYFCGCRFTGIDKNENGELGAVVLDRGVFVDRDNGGGAIVITGGSWVGYDMSSA